MKFRTEIDATPPMPWIQPCSQLLTIGSCFAENMGTKLADNKLKIANNPFGTLFSPLAIFKVLRMVLEQKTENKDLYLANDSGVFHHDFHSSISAISPQKLHTTIQEKTAKTLVFLQNTDIVILTFGTAWVYKHLETGQYIANCHKTSATKFEKMLLSVKDITRSFSDIYGVLKKDRPNLKILLTVSPVRHTKETLALNQASKSVLRLACHYLCEDFDDVKYFPAYEIMLDDLRDYRFYTPDLVHPNEMAESYIFEKLLENYGSASLREFVAHWAKIQQALAHRPFNTRSVSHQRFLQNLLIELEKLSSSIDVSAEIAAVQRQRNENWHG